MSKDKTNIKVTITENEDGPLAKAIEHVIKEEKKRKK
jgi:hypothetical protein